MLLPDFHYTESETNEVIIYQVCEMCKPMLHYSKSISFPFSYEVSLVMGWELLFFVEIRIDI